jgi:hypothetical protein
MIGEYEYEKNQNNRYARFTAEQSERWLRRMPDLLPVSLQDLLRRFQPAVRKVRTRRRKEITAEKIKQLPFFAFWEINGILVSNGENL